MSERVIRLRKPVDRRSFIGGSDARIIMGNDEGALAINDAQQCAHDLAVRRALEAAGVEFIDENGGGPGASVGFVA